MATDHRRSPHRGDAPLNASLPRLGLGAIVVLVALRLTVGLHFFGEGLRKIRDKKPFSSAFFSQAKGPLAPIYKARLWDPDGKARLGWTEVDGQVGVDPAATLAAWDQFVQRAGSYYGFDDKRKADAKRKLQQRKDQLNWFYAANGGEIREYFLGLKRRDQQAASEMVQRVDSLWGQSQTIQSELAGKKGPWLADVEEMWSGLERDMQSLASNGASRLTMTRQGRHFMDTEAMDGFVPYFDIAIGVLLVLGLCTRPAACLGAAFLASIALSQWPWARGAAPAWAQWIEMLAMLALAAMAAGQFGGLDAVWTAWRERRRGARASASASA